MSDFIDHPEPSTSEGSVLQSQSTIKSTTYYHIPPRRILVTDTSEDTGEDSEDDSVQWKPEDESTGSSDSEIESESSPAKLTRTCGRPAELTKEAEGGNVLFELNRLSAASIIETGDDISHSPAAGTGETQGEVIPKSSPEIENNLVDVRLPDALLGENASKKRKRSDIGDLGFDGPDDPDGGPEDPDGGPPGGQGGWPPTSKYPLLLFMIQVKHSLTEAAVKDIAKMMNEFSTETIGIEVLPRDPRTLVKRFRSYVSEPEKHVLCHVCGCYVGIQGSENLYQCVNCQTERSFLEAFKNDDYVVHISLIEQLTDLFEDCLSDLSFIQKKGENKKSLIFESIRDGDAYKKAFSQLSEGDDFISLTVNCDGVPVFKSSGTSFWAVKCTINEMSVKEKRKHVMVPTLFYGPKKPDMNQFLVPLAKECLHLFNVGFSYTRDGCTKTCKVIVQIIIADSVARCLFLKSMQFNGEWGCTESLHPGEEVAKGKGHVRVYPHMDCPRRTMEETLKHAKQASVLNEKPFHVKGIKGETIIQFLPQIDIIDALVPDYMHCGDLGVGRQFYKLWFKPKTVDQDGKSPAYNISEKKEEANVRLKLIEPPFFISRNTRDLSLSKFWKAHEWHAWIMYYSVPVLKDLLPAKYLHHWMLFVEGLFILSQERISRAQVINAENLLVEFVVKTEELYGKEQCSFNVHLLEHLAKSVLNWGPLPDHSAYLYEDYNQVLLRSIRSSKGVLTQMATYYQAQRCLPTVLSTTGCRDFQIVDDFLRSQSELSTVNSVRISLSDTCDVTVFSVRFDRPVSDRYRLPLRASGFKVEKDQIVTVGHRILVNGEVFHSKCYKNVKERNSYTVLLEDGNLFSIEAYLIVLKSETRNCVAVGRYLSPNKQFRFRAGFENPLHVRCLQKEQDALSILPTSEIVTKVVFMKCDHLTVNVACIPPNRTEIIN